MSCHFLIYCRQNKPNEKEHKVSVITAWWGIKQFALERRSQSVTPPAKNESRVSSARTDYRELLPSQ